MKKVVKMNGKSHSCGKRALTQVNELLAQSYSIGKITMEAVDKTNMNLVFDLAKPPMKRARIGL